MSGPSSPGSSRLGGRIAVVTGGASGIGREIGRSLAAEGALTVLVARDAARTAEVAREIAPATGPGRVEIVPVRDLADLSEVRRAADEILRRYPRVHILVNNAGAYFHRRELTSDGHERTFALNVLAPFVLTSLLAPRLTESAPARVVNMGSAAHQGYSVDFEDLEGRARYGGFRAYGRSKLELLLLTREFARRLKASGVTVNAVHPGFVRSGFAQNNGGWVAWGMRVLMSAFGRSPRRGADSAVWLANDPTVPGTTGEFFTNRRVGRSSRRSYIVEDGRQLYALCCRLTGVEPLPDPKGTG